MKKRLSTFLDNEDGRGGGLFSGSGGGGNADRDGVVPSTLSRVWFCCFFSGRLFMVYSSALKVAGSMGFVDDGGGWQKRSLPLT